jgi:hypothetical protein
MDETRHVWLLWHGDDIEEDTPEAKLLGVYSSEERAQERIDRSRSVTGFQDYPDAFTISRSEVDKDEWVEGFIRYWDGEPDPGAD